MIPADIIAEARTWLGTPFHHQGRAKGAGVDCIGLVIGVAHALGLSDFDTTHYGRIPSPLLMGAGLRANMLAADRAEPGSVLWFAFDRVPMHVGIVTDSGLIHAYSVAGRVVETGLDPQWIARSRGAFRFPGVVY
jgi:cell wall-associated NlpC family hydrolase